MIEIVKMQENQTQTVALIKFLLESSKTVIKVKLFIFGF